MSQKFDFENLFPSTASLDNSSPLPSFNSLEATVIRNMSLPEPSGIADEAFNLGHLSARNQTRKRRRPQQMRRYYNCQEPGCHKAYESISHLNTHIRRKSHGPPLSKSDFK